MLECHIQKISLRGKFPFEQVQAVLLVLGGYEVPPGVNMTVPTSNDEKVSTNYKMSAVRINITISSFS
jgi:hypothetical protein